MNKFLLLLFISLVACSSGPTNEEIQAQIDSSLGSINSKLEANSSKISELDENFEKHDLSITTNEKNILNNSENLDAYINEKKLNVYTNSVKGVNQDSINSFFRFYHLIAYCNEGDVAIGGYWNQADWNNGVAMKIQSFTTQNAEGFGVISSKNDLEQLTVFVYCLENK